MKKEWLLVIGSVSLTLFTAFILVRWFAPQLLGLPVDLQMVRIAKKVPPFFDGVFRPEDYKGTKFIIQDPFIIRAKPLLPFMLGMGPNDLLGFRNKSVPDIADIITIGDSQTYGNNATLEENWPSSMVEDLTPGKPVLYNMSVGGWGAGEYFEIFNKALYFQPKIIIVAFYTGNDAVDTFKKVYGDDRWKSFRLNPDLTSSDAPTLKENIAWSVQFHDGKETIFTPDLRFVSNSRESPAVMVGYEIIGKIAEQMGLIAEANNIKLVFTIIPTKELAFKKRIFQENIALREDYKNLVDDEEKNIFALAGKLQGIPGSVYVDLLAPLQQAIITSEKLYPANGNGHPLAQGYKLIGETLANEAVKLLPGKSNGVFWAQYSTVDEKFRPVLVKNNLFYIISSKRILTENGWSAKNIKKIDSRTISKLSYGGIINTVDPSRYGPAAFN